MDIVMVKTCVATSDNVEACDLYKYNGNSCHWGMSILCSCHCGI